MKSKHHVTVDLHRPRSAIKSISVQVPISLWSSLASPSPVDRPIKQRSKSALPDRRSQLPTTQTSRQPTNEHPEYTEITGIWSKIHQRGTSSNLRKSDQTSKKNENQNNGEIVKLRRRKRRKNHKAIATGHLLHELNNQKKILDEKIRTFDSGLSHYWEKYYQCSTFSPPLYSSTIIA